MSASYVLLRSVRGCRGGNLLAGTPAARRLLSVASEVRVGPEKRAGDPRWLPLRALLERCDTPSLCDADKSLSTKVVDYAIRPRHMRSRGITLIGLARTVRTIGGPGEVPDFRNLVEIPVTVGGVEIKPGDVIVGDDDGIVVLGNDFDQIKDLALKASEIIRNERAVLTEVLDNNRCLLEFMNLMDSHKEGVA